MFRIEQTEDGVQRLFQGDHLILELQDINHYGYNTIGQLIENLTGWYCAQKKLFMVGATDFDNYMEWKRLGSKTVGPNDFIVNEAEYRKFEQWEAMRFQPEDKVTLRQVADELQERQQRREYLDSAKQYTPEEIAHILATFRDQGIC